MKKLKFMPQNRNEQNTVLKVSRQSIVLESILTIYKMVAGILGNSGAMISDAIHSASDVLSTIVVMIGVKMAGKEADKKHPYGHERMESVAALILAVFLGATGVGIGYNGFCVIITGKYKSLAMPDTIALVAAIVSIVIKELMYWYARYYGKKERSSALIADAWHHRSDALSSVGSLIGIYGAQKGIIILEPIASIIISLFIIKVACSIFQSSMNEMMDCACEAEIEAQIRYLTLEQSGVKGISVLKTRKFGTKIYVDIDIYVEENLSLEQAAMITEIVHDTIEQQLPVVKHVLVRALPECCT